ncbi:hypothetical protein [uncultured Sphingomonas sp.]|uniref:hypothetical protein n=1 Tax=uncultured Sphingomonas sp. TaxID=158754 RepID=UPI00260E0A7C|nr:hypothetical protein [uncultured Sphingomonas sp.]
MPVDAAPPQALPASETSSASVRGIAAAAIAGGDAPAAIVALDHLAAMGATVSAGGQESYAGLVGPDVKARLADRFAANAVPVRASQLETAIPADSPLVEGLAFDARSGRLFAGTVIDGRLLTRRSVRTGWQTVAIGRPTGGLFGMAVDARRRLLWIAVAEVEQVRTPGERSAGLLAVNIDRLRVVRRVPLPAALAGSLPGDVAIAGDGTVYASDPARGRVLICRPGCAALAELVPEDVFGSAQGLVLTPDEGALIVADYGDGLHRIDLHTGQVAPISTAEPAMLDGIDGLIADGAALIAIQNGTSPRRILRLTLDPSASRIERTEILERDNPDWGEPTLGAIVGDRLFYVADGQWERYGPNGTLMDDGGPHDTPIRSLALPRE